MENKNWNYSEGWIKIGATFSVEIKRWEKQSFDSSLQLSVDNIWNIYVYYFKSDVDYERLTDSWSNSDLGYDFHGGVTYSSFDKKDVKIFGCDYNHYNDDRFLLYKNLEEAQAVLDDANYIYNYLSNREVTNV